jgi:hypothetical protein
MIRTTIIIIMMIPIMASTATVAPAARPTGLEDSVGLVGVLVAVVSEGVVVPVIDESTMKDEGMMIDEDIMVDVVN